jgi:DNA-directed RNA polymerase specialized sigma subunit
LKQQGRSLREIGAELGISHMKVKRILNESNKL